MNCGFTNQTCGYIHCGAWNERLQACRFILALDKYLGKESDGQSAIPADDRRHLTPIEQNILDLIAQGYSNKRISLALGIGYQTVKNHVTHILLKLGVRSRVEAVVMSFKRVDKIDEARARA